MRPSASSDLSEVGCKTSRPCSSANRFTGLGAGRSPRPTGRSGWVRPSAMSCAAPCSAASATSATAGVPAKTRRRRGRSGRLAQLLREPRADPLLLELRKVLDEHLALQVIQLVLDADREQALRFEGERVAVLVERAHFPSLGPPHGPVAAPTPAAPPSDAAPAPPP